MGTTFREYKKAHPVDDALMEEARKATNEKIRLFELREVRKACGLTQTELATCLGIGQKRISAVENGKLDNLKIDTLRRYIAGLGGTLEISAHLPQGDIRLS